MHGRKYKIGEIAEVVSGGTPSTKRDDYWNGDVSWITPKDLSDHNSRFVSVGERSITEKGLVNSSAQMVPRNTVLLTSRAPVGYVALAEREVCTNQGFKSLVCKEEVAYYGFIYYALQYYKPLLEAHATGATFKELSAGRLKAIEVGLPAYGEQQRIAEILSAYDDLIETNQRRIARLEEAARLLYREWFVHLRFPGHEHTPVTDGVPQGWEQKKMDEVCDSIGGGTPRTKVEEYWRDGDITWFTPSDVTASDCLVLLDSDRKINRRGLNNSSAKMLPPDTIMMTSRASVGFFGLYDGDACTNQGFISVVPHREKMRMYLLHNLMARTEEIDILASGSTYKEINKTTFRNMDVVVPPDALLEEFSQFAYDTVKQTRALKKQNTRLKEARDLLLPRLMSGAIPV